MALKHFSIEIEQGENSQKPIKKVNVRFLSSQAPIPWKELFAESQELVEAIEEAKKRGIEVKIII